MRFVLPCLFVVLVAGCAGGSIPVDAAVDTGTDTGTPDSGPVDTGTPDTGLADTGPRPDGSPFLCPQDGVRGSGTHRLFAQGHESPPRPDGSWPFLHEWQRSGGDPLLCDDAAFVIDTNMDGIWQPGEVPRNLGPSALVHGEHFLIGVGSFVEFTIPLCDDITGNVAFYIPNFDEAGSEALHQLVVVHQAGGETLIAETIDREPGSSGYNPFIRVVAGNDPDVVPGDVLLLRSINLSGRVFSVMIWNPPSEYESWVRIEVP